MNHNIIIPTLLEFYDSRVSYHDTETLFGSNVIHKQIHFKFEHLQHKGYGYESLRF